MKPGFSWTCKGEEGDAVVASWNMGNYDKIQGRFFIVLVIKQVGQVPGEVTGSLLLAIPKFRWTPS